VRVARSRAVVAAGNRPVVVARVAGISRQALHRRPGRRPPAAGSGSTSPLGPAKRGPGRRKIDPYAHLRSLAKQPQLKASVIHERLVAEHGLTGHYQRVKVYVREARARVAAGEPAPAGFHRRFEVLPGAQAQVDWG
jgi:hypothetical protein